MMKRTLTTIIWSLAALTAVAQTTVVFPLKQMTGTAHRRELTVTSLDGVRKVGTNLVYPVPMTVTAQGGQFRTNLFTGNYRLTMQGVPGYSDAFVPDTNVVVYWNDLVPATPSALTLSQYYTKMQIDTLLAAIGSTSGALTNGATASLRSVELLSDAQYPFNYRWTNSGNLLKLLGGNDPTTCMSIDSEGYVTFPRGFILMPNPDPGVVGLPITVNYAGGLNLSTVLSGLYLTNVSRLSIGQYSIYEPSPYSLVITNSSGAEVRLSGDDGMMSIHVPGGGIWTDYGFYGPLHGALSGSIDGGSFSATNTAPAEPGAPKAWRDLVVGGVIYKVPLYQ